MASSRDRTAAGGPAAVEEFVIRIRMVAAEDVSDDFLEELAILIEGTLTEHAEAIAPGASAAANFAMRHIELDFIVEARSPEEMHQKVGEVIGIAMAAVPEREPQSLVFAASQASATLVPA